MQAYETNPFPPRDADRHALWDMMVRRDIEAFLAADWSMVEDDFVVDGFTGIDGRSKLNCDSWRLTFPDLASYREAWLEQARAFQLRTAEADRRRELFEATTLRDIDLVQDTALLHKKFDGSVTCRDGSRSRLCWQTLYTARRIEGRWKLAGFVGYLPNPMGVLPFTTSGFDEPPAPSPRKHLPQGATQHTTAGPYSPVLQIDPGRLVVISGQAALDHDGQVIGETIEAQARLTLENCFTQLATAGCSPADVFKVNVYMRDLNEWPRFNAVYQEMLPHPRPVRTAVQTGLLLSLKVEVEMWAVTHQRAALA